MNNKELIKYALEAREKSYSPYSNFKVGAAILTKTGKVYTGCNIESASYTPTICAERTALAKCVSDGYTDIDKIAVVGSLERISYPCGVCRQFLREFGNDITIICATSEDNFIEYKLNELLPNSFGPEDL